MPVAAGMTHDHPCGLIDVVQWDQPGVEGKGHIGGDGRGVLSHHNIDVPVQPSQEPVTDEAADDVAADAAPVEDVLQVDQE